ncbi:MAG TPA: dethiobiotin synthase [Gemmatimonadales bacterium]|nr:dethiobiotin synthase [Gemmatimonadales bacterium]
MTTYLLITATDTNVGKTWSSIALATALLKGGKKVVGIKPVETGTSVDPDDGEDGVKVARATGQTAPTMALYRFRAQVSAPLAAEEEETKIDWKGLLGDIRKYGAGADVAIIEGSGGLMTPITWEHGALDLAKEFEARAVVAALDKLGTINHTLLTVDELEHAGVEVLGIILSEPEKADESTGSNAAALQRMRPGLRVFPVPRLMNPNEGTEYVKELAGLV